MQFMEKNLFWTLVFLGIVTVLSPGHLFAETAGPVQAGVAVAVEGEVKATTPPEKAAHSLKDGEKIFMGDKIETGADGQLQILLLDETVFTLGPLSTITVDEFVYDPENVEGKSGVVKGIFRAVSGKVAQQKPEDVPADFLAGSKSRAKTVDPGSSEASFPEAQEDALALAELIDAKDSTRERAQSFSEATRH